MAAYQVDRGWVAAWVKRTRAEQGLPPVIEDPAALATIAALVRPYLIEKGYLRADGTPVRKAS
ncbi:hypothetical protein GCM10017559_07790 [Streptosporangium longisporum]|uniref:Uncharacterized protein n=1 Tax=Streptosporangium longisporum TaxID=46187 RepID=A0ABN3XSK1_9ACTN